MQHSPYADGSPQDRSETTPRRRMHAPVRGHPDLRCISSLSELVGWRRTGRHAWTLGSDDRLPRLTAQTRGRHAWLTLAPPIDEAAASTWDMSDVWADAMRARRLCVVEAEVGHAYETCSACDCPLRDLDAKQTCPACGNTTATRCLPEAARHLVTVSVPFTSEAEVAAAADELTELFTRLTGVLQARLSGQPAKSSHPSGQRRAAPETCRGHVLRQGMAPDEHGEQHPG